MAVTKEMADQWEKEAKEAGATHLIIVCEQAVWWGKHATHYRGNKFKQKLI